MRFFGRGGLSTRKGYVRRNMGQSGSFFRVCPVPHWMVAGQKLTNINPRRQTSDVFSQRRLGFNLSARLQVIGLSVF